MANETPSRPPPLMANAILNFHFDFLNPSLSLSYFFSRLLRSSWSGFGLLGPITGSGFGDSSGSNEDAVTLGAVEVAHPLHLDNMCDAILLPFCWDAGQVTVLLWQCDVILWLGWKAKGLPFHHSSLLHCPAPHRPRSLQMTELSFWLVTKVCGGEILRSQELMDGQGLKNEIWWR